MILKIKEKRINTVDKKTNISKSKAKREARRKQVEKMQRQKRINKIAGIVVMAVVVLAVLSVAGRQLYIMAIRTTPDSDYGAGIASDGKIENTEALPLLTLADYQNISVPADEVAATEEEVQNTIDSLLASYEALSTDESLEIADGDKVNIDFDGTVDGVAFDGGSSGGAGYDLTIGSGAFIDDFEEQLIGHKPGEEVTVEVTFPENYTNAELANKDASFAVVINGIMKIPELTDEFVAGNLAETEGVSTAEEYRAKVENDFYESHLSEYLINYMIENSEVTSYPKDYLQIKKSLLKYEDGMGDDIKNEIAYEKELTERAKEAVKEDLVYQAIFESAGLTFDMAAYEEKLAAVHDEDPDYVERLKSAFGETDMAHNGLKQTVRDYLIELYR